MGEIKSPILLYFINKFCSLSGGIRERIFWGVSLIITLGCLKGAIYLASVLPADIEMMGSTVPYGRMLNPIILVLICLSGLFTLLVVFSMPKYTPPPSGYELMHDEIMKELDEKYILTPKKDIDKKKEIDK